MNVEYEEKDEVRVDESFSISQNFLKDYLRQRYNLNKNKNDSLNETDK